MHISFKHRGSSRSTKCMRHSVGSLSFLSFLLLEIARHAHRSRFAFSISSNRAHTHSHTSNISQHSLTDNEFVLRRVKFDFYLESRRHLTQEHSDENQDDQPMNMKYTKLMQETNKNTDDDNQHIYRDDHDSKKRNATLATALMRDSASHVLHLSSPWPYFFLRSNFSK